MVFWLYSPNTHLMDMLAGKMTIDELNAKEAILRSNVNIVTGSYQPNPIQRAAEEEEYRIEKSQNDHNMDVYVRSLLGIGSAPRRSSSAQLQR